MLFYEADLLTNATVINDAIKFVPDYSNNNKKLISKKEVLQHFPWSFNSPRMMSELYSVIICVVVIVSRKIGAL
jgi:hypothetical protein